MLFAKVTPPASWSWAALFMLTWPAPRAPEAVTWRMPEPPMFVWPVKSLAPFETMTVPEPTLVRPIAPVILESIDR